MKTQNGFSIVGIVITILILIGASFVGWRVYGSHGKKTDDASQKAGNTNIANKQKGSKEEYKAPEGFVVYDNRELGFRFSYPNHWGALSPKEGSSMILELQTVAAFSESNDIQFTVWADKVEKFKTYPNYKQFTFMPIPDGDDYIWKHASSDYGVEAGTTVEFSVAKKPKINDVQVYGIYGGHACEDNQQWLFPINDTFVGINIIYGSCYVLDDTIPTQKKTELDASYEKLKSDIETIYTTIVVY